MNRLWRGAGVLALLLAALGARTACAAVLSADEIVTPPPTTDDKPIVVKIGLRLEHVGNISADSDSFNFSGMFHIQWRDPRLAYTPELGEDERVINPEKIWTPAPQFANLIDDITTHYRAAAVGPDGTVHMVWEVTATLAPDMDLRRFPFDRQTLVIEVRPPLEAPAPMLFLADPEESGVVPAARTQLPLWEFTGFSLHDARDEGVSATGKVGADFDIRLRRRWGYYVLRLFLPLALILLASWAFLVLRLDDIQNQLYATFGTLLSVIAFAFAVQSFVPQVPVLTLYDRFYLLCFAIVVLELAEVCLVHVLLHHVGEAPARRVRYYGRMFIPFVSVCGAAALFATSLLY